MKNFNVCDPMEKSRGLMLDGQTLAHIEVDTLCDMNPSPLIFFKVLLNSEGTDEGSLLTLLCRCITPFGKPCWQRSLHISLTMSQASGSSAFGCAPHYVISPTLMLGRTLIAYV